MQSTDQTDGNYKAIVLSFFTLVNYLTFYSLNLLLARNLSREEFNDYNVGVSTLLLLAAVAPLGLEKYALKIVPVHSQRADWEKSRGFLRFAIGATMLVSVVLSLIFDTLLESILLLQHEGYHIAIPLIVGCLPLLSIFYVLLEVATAYGAPITAAALYRVALPMLLLGLNVVAWWSPRGITGLSASWCYALSWLCVTFAMWWVIARRLPSPIKEATPIYEKMSWLGESTPLLLNGLLLTIMTQSGVIVLELSSKFHSEASVFAVAMQTGAFVVLFTTSTNRFYLPRVSLLLEQQDHKGLTHLRRQRLLLIGSIAILFVSLVLFFGRSVLRVFGDDFERGYPATCVIAVGAAISSTFSLAPFGLQYAGFHRLVLKCSAVATVASVVTCIILANLFGTLGAALAYAFPLSFLYIFLAYVAWRRLDEEGELW